MLPSCPVEIEIGLASCPGEPQIQRSLPGSDHGERHGGCDLLLSAFSPGEGLLRGLGLEVGDEWG